MAGNPNPQHNPTDGLGVAVSVQVSGSSGSSVITALKTPGANKPYPGVYTLTLSKSAAGGFASAVTATASLVDASNAAYTPSGSAVFRSYNDPANSAGSAPAYYNPSRFSDGTISYNENIVSVGPSSGVITARNVGQGIIEVAFPAFDNTVGNTSGATGTINQLYAEPVQMIYVQIIVTVIP